jgi:hypothetical protein
VEGELNEVTVNKESMPVVSSPVEMPLLLTESTPMPSSELKPTPLQTNVPDEVEVKAEPEVPVEAHEAPEKRKERQPRRAPRAVKASPRKKPSRALASQAKPVPNMESPKSEAESTVSAPVRKPLVRRQLKINTETVVTEEKSSEAASPAVETTRTEASSSAASLPSEESSQKLTNEVL